MDDIAKRLVGCFQTVFPDLEAKQIPAASQETVAAWDSVATVTLITVIEDEFGVALDLERLQEFDSFSRLYGHVVELVSQTNA